MPRHSALIIIDSGYSHASLIEAASRIVGICDVYEWRTAAGAQLDREALDSFAGDPLPHGTTVLEKMRACAPEAPLVLVKAYGPERRLIRTAWENGQPVAPGWTEGYLWAVDLAQMLGLTSVANCSFGGFTHAMDGSGWESFQLARAIGAGKPGHALVAAAGPGDGRATHASWLTAPGLSTGVDVLQKETSRYSLWVSGAAAPDWTLEVKSGATTLQRFEGSQVPANFWNGRQQHTFMVEGQGEFTLLVSRRDIAGGADPGDTGFDCWFVAGGGGVFLNRVDAKLIAEPAVFPHVISVGLRAGSYAPDQAMPGGKPDVLLPGGGAISFRLPEVTAYAGALLAAAPHLDVDALRAAIGKYPLLPFSGV